MEAGMFAIRKERTSITQKDFLSAIEKVALDFNRNRLVDVEGAMFA
jgi:ATP-dependent 26S proteasome regulatory subunit